MTSAGTLAGKIALVTGGSRGIGRAIALRLAQEGACVIISYFRNRDAAEQTAREIRNFGVETDIVRANAGDPEKINAMFDLVENRYKRLDILINNAASGVARDALDVDEQSWDWTMNINARAFLLCARRAAVLMPPGGRMIAISSLGAGLVMPQYAAVGISKAALEAVMRYLAIELAPKQIGVNAVAASAVDTEALKLYTSGSMRGNSWRTTPAGRMVRPEDVAGVVAFLCGKEAEMIRGQTIVVDGGWSLCRDGEVETGKK